MVRQANGELIPVAGFSYGALRADVAEQVKAAVGRIHQKLQKTLEDVVAIGNELRAVKAKLPHGMFGLWLDEEFSWRERTARNFMSVADRFGPKSATIADLPIEPSAAYLLARPSAPDEARQTALRRAEAGERITVLVAREILDEFLNGREAKPQSARQLERRVAKVLEHAREHCSPEQLALLARQLREFADAVDKPGESANAAEKLGESADAVDKPRGRKKKPTE